jgi:hypothetical protein
MQVVAANFKVGITMLTHAGSLNPNSEFVKSALDMLNAYVESHSDAAPTSDNMSFLSKAGPGVESQIAGAMRLSMLK